MKLQGLSENRDGPSDSDNYKTKLDDSNIREAILRATILCINSGLWTGIPGYWQFIFL